MPTSSKLIISAMLASVLIGCQPVENSDSSTQTGTTPEPQTKEQTNPPVSEVKDSKPIANFVDFAALDGTVINFGKSQKAINDAGELVVFGSPADAISASNTGGVSFKLSDENERAFSGKTVLIEVEAASQSADPTEFSVAYSTSDVGNSGWNNFVASASFETYSFTYSIPELKNGNGDYLGIMSTGAEMENGVRIRRVTIAEYTE